MSSFLDTVGNFLGTSNEGAINKATGTLDDISAKAAETTAANRQILSEYLQQMKGMYGENSAQYNEAVKSVADAISDYGTYDKSVEDFLDPMREQTARQATDAITSSAANAGSLFSSSYLDKVAAKQRALSNEAWKTAYDAYTQDRQNALAEQQQKVQNATGLASLYGSDRTNLANALGDYASNMANSNNAELQTYSNVATNKANLQAQKNNGVWDAVGGIAKIAGSIFG